MRDGPTSPEQRQTRDAGVQADVLSNRSPGLSGKLHFASVRRQLHVDRAKKSCGGYLLQARRGPAVFQAGTRGLFSPWAVGPAAVVSTVRVGCESFKRYRSKSAALRGVTRKRGPKSGAIPFDQYVQYIVETADELSVRRPALLQRRTGGRSDSRAAAWTEQGGTAATASICCRCMQY